MEEDLALLSAQTHRRFVKSHMPFDCLPVYQEMKYIHVARDGRDACMSFHNHLTGMAPSVFSTIARNAIEDGLTGPPPPTPADPREYYLLWIAQAEGVETGGARGSYFAFEKTYWDERSRPNLLMVHYNDLKADLAGEIARMSDFLEIVTPPARIAEFARAAEFSTMKGQGDEIMSSLATHFVGGSQRFLHKGTNGRWRDVLTKDDLTRFDSALHKALPPACASWLQSGRLGAGDPRTLADQTLALHAAEGLASWLSR